MRYPDHEGGSPSVLTPSNIPNVDYLGTQILVVGDCVRAIPYFSWGWDGQVGRYAGSRRVAARAIQIFPAQKDEHNWGANSKSTDSALKCPAALYM